MNGNGDFEVAVRDGLATLAREAVPETSGSVSALPLVRPVPARRRRRFDVRLLAALVVIAVATASIVVALSLRGESPKRPLGPHPSWTKVARFPLAARSAQAAVFTGHDVIVWGGRSDSAGGAAIAAGPGTPRYTLGDGAAYDVGTDRWRVLPRAPIAGRYDPVAVWTGSEMLVVGGQRDHATAQAGIGFLRDGAAYDPRAGDGEGSPMRPAVRSSARGPARSSSSAATASTGQTAARSSSPRTTPARGRWTRLPVFAPASQLVSVGARLYAWSSATGRGAVYQPRVRRWRALPAVIDADNPLQDSLAIAYRDRLVVVGREADPMGDGPDVARVAILGPQGWSSASSLVGPPLGDAVFASTDGAVAWSTPAALGAETIDRSMRSFSLLSVDDAPISLERSGESIVGIGYRRFFVWGGRLAGTSQDPTNRPTADGAIVDVPSLQP